MPDVDRELLEAAARAAGHESFRWVVQPHGDRQGLQFPDPMGVWNPLTDDGDALRLAVKMRMCVEPWGAGASAVVTVNNQALVAEPHYGDDPSRATRRAIVRAAAQIGGLS